MKRRKWVPDSWTPERQGPEVREQLVCLRHSEPE